MILEQGYFYDEIMQYQFQVKILSCTLQLLKRAVHIEQSTTKWTVTPNHLA